MSDNEISNLKSLPSLSNVVKRYDLMPSKSLGQNFLFNLNLTEKIASYAGSLENHIVIEIGPGPGGLTRSILNLNPKKLIAIEKDSKAVFALNDYLLPKTNNKLEIIEGDALKIDFVEYCKSLNSKVKIIANLPYNISTKLLTNWLDNIEIFDSLTLMFQKEVADRIVAQVNTKSYGKLSIKSQLLCDIEHCMDISPDAFYPPPKVTSTVLHFTAYDKPKYQVDFEKLDKLTTATFNQRRKTLRVSLKSISDNPQELLKKANIDGVRRPETLTLQEFCKLASFII